MQKKNAKIQKKRKKDINAKKNSKFQISKGARKKRKNKKTRKRQKIPIMQKSENIRR